VASAAPVVIGVLPAAIGAAEVGNAAICGIAEGANILINSQRAIQAAVRIQSAVNSTMTAASIKATSVAQATVAASAPIINLKFL